MRFSILIKNLNRPALQIRREQALGGPIDAVGDQDGIGPGAFRVLKTDDEADFA